jgi:hypothetical protein
LIKAAIESLSVGRIPEKLFAYKETSLEYPQVLLVVHIAAFTSPEQFIFEAVCKQSA